MLYLLIINIFVFCWSLFPIRKFTGDLWKVFPIGIQEMTPVHKHIIRCLPGYIIISCSYKDHNLTFWPSWLQIRTYRDVCMYKDTCACACTHIQSLSLCLCLSIFLCICWFLEFVMLEDILGVFVFLFIIIFLILVPIYNSALRAYIFKLI